MYRVVIEVCFKPKLAFFNEKLLQNSGIDLHYVHLAAMDLIRGRAGEHFYDWIAGEIQKES